MNFVADEDVDYPIVRILLEMGHNVRYIAEIEPGISDDEVLMKSNKEESILITADKDFGDLIFRQKLISTGVVLLRLRGLSPNKKAQLVKSAVEMN